MREGADFDSQQDDCKLVLGVGTLQMLMDHEVDDINTVSRRWGCGTHANFLLLTTTCDMCNMLTTRLRWESEPESEINARGGREGMVRRQ